MRGAAASRATHALRLAAARYSGGFSLVHRLAALMLLLLVAPSMSCPRSCKCGLDRKGRRLVGCREGDGKDPMPLPGVTDKAEVFEVAPPADRPNYYTIGPIFGPHHKKVGPRLSLEC